MTITGTASEIYRAVSECLGMLAQELEDDLPAIRKAHAMRLADEKSKRSWDVILVGVRRLIDTHTKLLVLGRALSCMTHDDLADVRVTLSPEEAALFSFAKDETLPKLPDFDMTTESA